MKIKVVTPIRVGDAELARRQERYGQLCPPGIAVELFDLPEGEGVPRSLDSAWAIRESERLVTEEALATDRSAYDAVMPDCVLDPGLDRLERESPVPAFGILKLTAGFLVALGRRFASVTRNEPIGEELRSRLEAYGYLPGFDRNVVLDLDFSDIADDARWNEVLGEVGGSFAGSGTTAVINGCSAVDLTARPGGVSLVDPTELALRLLNVTAEAGLGALPQQPAPSGGRRG